MKNTSPQKKKVSVKTKKGNKSVPTQPSPLWLRKIIKDRVLLQQVVILRDVLGPPKGLDF